MTDRQWYKRLAKCVMAQHSAQLNCILPANSRLLIAK